MRTLDLMKQSSMFGTLLARIRLAKRSRFGLSSLVITFEVTIVSFVAVWTICFLTAAMSSSAPSVESRIAAIENETHGNIGIVAFDTKTGTRIERRANDRFPMCSTFKLLAVAAVLQRVDQGKEKSDRFVPYTEKDILDYAPVTKEHLKEGGMTLRDLCQAAIEQSDNTAANLILQTIGGPSGLTQFARSLGDKFTRLDRVEPELNDVRPGDDRDTTTPAAMCEDLRHLFESDILSTESRHRLDDWLQHCETGAAMIRAAMPTGWRVGDKTGRSKGGATNDIAIIYPPDGAPIFVAIYSVGLTGSDAERSAAVANAGKIVADTFRPD
jgi:beta-lactamase class A